MELIQALEEIGLTYRGLNYEWEQENANFGLNAEATDKLYLKQGGNKICIVIMRHDIENNFFTLSLKYYSKPVRQVQGIPFADLKRRIQSVIDSYVIVKFGEQMSPWMALHSLLNIIER